MLDDSVWKHCVLGLHDGEGQSHGLPYVRAIRAIETEAGRLIRMCVYEAERLSIGR